MGVGGVLVDGNHGAIGHLQSLVDEPAADELRDFVFRDS